MEKQIITNTGYGNLGKSLQDLTPLIVEWVDNDVKEGFELVKMPKKDWNCLVDEIKLAINHINKNTSFIINKTEKPSSYEFGKAGNRFKIYFDNANDLAEQIKNLKDKGLYKDEE